jgi:hypothetical protein
MQIDQRQAIEFRKPRRKRLFNVGMLERLHHNGSELKAKLEAGAKRMRISLSAYCSVVLSLGLEAGALGCALAPSGREF